MAQKVITILLGQQKEKQRKTHSMRIFSKTRLGTSAVFVYLDSSAKRGKQLDIITCAYPPSLSGLADHTYRVAEGLQKRGIRTHVWAPGNENSDTESADAVTRSLGRFGLHRLLLNDRLLGKAKDRYLLLQWEPAGYGLKSLNFPFCLWIASRVLRGSRLIVMFHNTFLPLEHASFARKVAGSSQRLLAFTLANCADAVFTSSGNGLRALSKLCFRSDKIRQLPIFSNIDSGVKPEDALRTRAQFVSKTEVLVGHFGRFTETVEPLLLPALAKFLQRNHRARILFVGECGPRYRSSLINNVPEFESRVIAPGVGSSKKIASLISACDFMFQPYPGGITTKCSSAMAALLNGKAVLSTNGPETEDIWKECGGVYLSDSSDPLETAEQLNRLAEDPDRVRQACTAAVLFYKQHFSVDRTVEAISACLYPSGIPVYRTVKAI